MLHAQMVHASSFPGHHQPVHPQSLEIVKGVISSPCINPEIGQYIRNFHCQRCVCRLQPCGKCRSQEFSPSIPPSHTVIGSSAVAFDSYLTLPDPSRSSCADSTTPPHTPCANPTTTPTHAQPLTSNHSSVRKEVWTSRAHPSLVRCMACTVHILYRVIHVKIWRN